MRSACLALLALATGANGAQCPAVGSGWTTMTLDDSIGFKAYHKVEGDTLNLRLEAQSTGWLGFGIPEQTVGHMKGADMVIASVNQGKVTATDSHAKWAPTTYAPTEYANGYTGLMAVADFHDDWTVVSGSEESGKTEVWLTRPLVTSDTQDRDIVAGSMRIIWAWGAGTAAAYHGVNRGVSSTIFFGTSTANPDLPAYDGKWTKTFDSYTVPNSHITTYACQSFDFPVDQDRHIVAFRPINVSPYNHHAILHICGDDSEDAIEYYDDHKTPQLCSYHATDYTCPGKECPREDGCPDDVGATCGGSSPLGSNTAKCSGLIWSWAVGMGDFILPPEAGLRVGSGGDKISKVILEIHYDNPGLVADHEDTMGFEAYYVNTPRANDAAMMIMGDVLVGLSSSELSDGDDDPPYEVGALPKGVESIHRQASCPKECTEDFSEPLNVFANFHHMHHYGRKFIHEKYGTDDNLVGAVGGRIDFWDNGFQQALSKPYTIAPGESFQTHCIYDTSSYTYSSHVNFGTPTSEEMCQEFIFYYPKQLRGGHPFAFCGLTSQGDGKTICGALGQGSDAFLPIDTQKDRPSPYADPLNFGKQPSEALSSSPGDTCTSAVDEDADDAPAATHVVEVEFVAAGDPTDYDTSARTLILDTLATKAGLTPPVVGAALTITAASVNVVASFPVASEAAATLAESTIATNLPDMSSLQTAMTSAGVSMTVTSAASASVAVVASPSSVPIAAIVGGAVGGVAVIVIAIVLYMYFKSTKATAKTKASGVPV